MSGLRRCDLADQRLLAPGADLGQPRIALDLDAPALIVGQVPVQGVELVQREQVDELLDELLGHEMPGNVEHHAAPGEARRVLDLDARDRPIHALHNRLPEDGRGQELAQRLHAVEEAGGLWRADRDLLRRHAQPVALRAQG